GGGGRAHGRGAASRAGQGSRPAPRRRHRAGDADPRPGPGRRGRSGRPPTVCDRHRHQPGLVHVPGRGQARPRHAPSRRSCSIGPPGGRAGAGGRARVDEPRDHPVERAGPRGADLPRGARRLDQGARLRRRHVGGGHRRAPGSGTGEAPARVRAGAQAGGPASRPLPLRPPGPLRRRPQAPVCARRRGPRRFVRPVLRAEQAPAGQEQGHGGARPAPRRPLGARARIVGGAPPPEGLRSRSRCRCRRAGRGTGRRHGASGGRRAAARGGSRPPVGASAGGRSRTRGGRRRRCPLPPGRPARRSAGPGPLGGDRVRARRRGLLDPGRLGWADLGAAHDPRRVGDRDPSRRAGDLRRGPRGDTRGVPDAGRGGAAGGGGGARPRGRPHRGAGSRGRARL
ncbi:MAG: hypothetical protein AVDCRST_MAG20-2301, partial [uncultured Acidimicrobiales bacterium]